MAAQKNTNFFAISTTYSAACKLLCLPVLEWESEKNQNCY